MNNSTTIQVEEQGPHHYRVIVRSKITGQYLLNRVISASNRIEAYDYANYITQE